MVDNNILQGKKHLHFIGIGGSGMYPLAQILHSEGYYITGSDNNETDTLAAVRKMGIPVYLGQRAENIAGADLIVHTAAIMSDNPELIAARASGVPVLERCELLGLITRRYHHAICVSGTHGKTTTSSILTQILTEAGIDPSAVIGGKLPLIGGSGRVGKSDVMVCESCEYVDTFLHLSPDIAVILNIDRDHMEYFKTLERLISSFRKFAEMATKSLIVNGDDVNTMKAVEGLGKETVTFGWSDTNDYYPANIGRIDDCFHSYDLMYRGNKRCTVKLYIPGKHNILNSMAAAAAAFAVGATPEQVATGIADFRGAGRRFEILGKCNGAVIADDYAHHPAELKVTLEAAKELHYKRVWAVFQPFTYSRTAMLLDDFAKVLPIADKVVMTEIMGSREKNTYNIYTKDLAAKIDGSVWFPTFEEVADYLRQNITEGDLVITLGCGDVYKIAKMLVQ